MKSFLGFCKTWLWDKIQGAIVAFFISVIFMGIAYEIGLPENTVKGIREAYEVTDHWLGVASLILIIATSANLAIRLIVAFVNKITGKITGEG
jgi:hypothetical protein